MSDVWTVDTNVLCVADRLTPQADEACVDACVSFLEDARDGLVLVDDSQRIVREYASNVGQGQPGPGTMFLRWLWQNVANDELCAQVTITEIAGTSENYAEFPTDPALANFDPSDRKFAAVVRAFGTPASVVNAVDSDWRIAEVDLQRNGVPVRFLCPQCC